MEQFNNQLAEVINKLDAIAKPAAQAVQYISDYTKKLNEQIRQLFNQFDFSKFYDNLLAPMKQLTLQIKKEKKDPDSIINYLSYVKNLSKYFWAMPYNIDISELKIIFDNVSSEKEFDDYTKRYFNKQKMQNLFSDIKLKIKKRMEVDYTL